jgi:hypothetical protein
MGSLPSLSLNPLWLVHLSLLLRPLGLLWRLRLRLVCPSGAPIGFVVVVVAGAPVTAVAPVGLVVAVAVGAPVLAVAPAGLVATVAAGALWDTLATYHAIR